MKVYLTCDCCSWSKTITEAEDGQSLGGTAGWYMSQHETKHKVQNATNCYYE
jgi:hypothetical protein